MSNKRIGTNELVIFINDARAALSSDPKIIGNGAIMERVKEEHKSKIESGDIIKSTYISSRKSPCLLIPLSVAIHVISKEKPEVREAVSQKIYSYFAEEEEKEVVKEGDSNVFEDNVYVDQSVEKEELTLERLFKMLKNLSEEVFAIRNPLKTSSTCNAEKSLEEFKAPEKYETESVPDIGTRGKVNQIVRFYATENDISFEDVWNKMYSLMEYHYHFKVRAYKLLHDKESKLDIVERQGQMHNLLALVTKELL